MRNKILLGRDSMERIIFEWSLMGQGLRSYPDGTAKILKDSKGRSE